MYSPEITAGPCAEEPVTATDLHTTGLPAAALLAVERYAHELASTATHENRQPIQMAAQLLAWAHGRDR